MTIEQKLNAFEKLGIIFREAAENRNDKHEYSKQLAKVSTTIQAYNGWFTENNVLNAFQSLGESLSRTKLETWLSTYKITDINVKSIGLIMAGNIPLVGFHDMLCVLLSGHKLIVKASENDQHLPKLVMNILISIEPNFKNLIHFTDGQLKTIDAIIATGSNNTSRYFEYYFGKYPNIIRKNRNSVAVLNGSETQKELALLGNDMFTYFGLGCRNVSKVFVPEGYDFDNIFKAIFDFKYVLQNNKYCNNYEYNKTVYLMQGTNLLENGFLLLKEDIGLASPVAVLYYEYYKSEADIIERLRMDIPHIQCIVSNMDFIKNSIKWGQTQSPELWDYADGVDTMKFLQNL